MTKVLLVSTVHSTGDVRIYHKEANSLIKAGYGVRLIAQKSDFVSESSFLINLPKPENRLKRLFITIPEAYNICIKENADIYHLHDPELIIVGILLKLKGKKVIYDVHEDLAKQVLIKQWIWLSLRKVIAFFVVRVEKLVGKIFDAIVAATPAIAKNFPQNKTVLVQNYPIKNELLKLDSKISYKERQNNIVYIGGISELRGIKEMISVMDLLPDRYDARLLLAGSFCPADLEDVVKEKPGWRKTEYLGWINRDQLTNLFSETKVGLVLLHPTPNYFESLPIKLFEYMSAGIPVIASDFPLWEEIVDGNSCGLTVNPFDPEAIAAAVKYLFDHPDEAEEMGKRGREAIEQKYNWDTEATKLLDLYHNITSEKNLKMN